MSEEITKTEALGFDPTLKKKKKKAKSADPEVLEQSVDTKEGDDDLFSGLKKKKKKATAATGEEKEVEKDLADVMGELKLKKKKKKAAAPVSEDFDKLLEKAGVLEDDKDVTKESTPEVETTTDLGPKYEDMLSRFFKVLKQNNPELAGERSGPKFRIPPPVVQREGTKRTLFANVQEIATVLQRSPEHLIQYLFAELGTSGSIDGQKRLIIKGRFQPKQIENVLRRYIIEYVTCKTCKSMNTELKRESANRLHFIVCKACGSTKSVSSIKTGFQAHVGRRRKM
ncbi:Translation initiation factor 2 subunit beta [Komagataella phaffii CBS 7435]|uniref:Beta subunit of the translation initiation factor eIF2 n=2 Tax=Komagataella phaffii TaxID=460519 RepID=C4QXJ0_KOMPG|nr:Beta subunit of the translation initiation factor eIF2 [Komagataella phaffii GS115]AOA60594.1 GQ67_02052T0 [Komagataella phaffii]KAI0464664.1 translation initiation factor eIF-2 beta subunit [Komagataella kurtzmanii]CAH2446777.1 Translation initiation factor 2 subunit beta [Komagataella phaffii CBS 7435]AOA66021.1 GQ68_02067T0 [Komagataella phaffii GS115]CAY67963.1 Beta subunit of the translation initiation factor eIF2 [Komagataella phaffii GS115]